MAAKGEDDFVEHVLVSISCLYWIGEIKLPTAASCIESLVYQNCLGIAI